MTEEVPKQDLLLKLLNMTAAEDNVALIAMKKANKLLLDNGWSWEKLLAGKITVIEDPFAKVSAPAPKPKAATFTASRPSPPPPPPPQPAANPWPQGVPPKNKGPKPVQPSTPPWQTPKPKPVAPVKPLHFRRDSTSTYRIASHIALPGSMVGQKLDIHKLDGTIVQETLGAFVEQDANGYYLYQIAKASKWKNKFAGGQPTINDL